MVLVPAQALHTLPEYAYVGLVTYGTHVHVHELGFQDFAKAYVFQVRLNGSRSQSCLQSWQCLSWIVHSNHGKRASLSWCMQAL